MLLLPANEVSEEKKLREKQENSVHYKKLVEERLNFYFNLPFYSVLGQCSGDSQKGIQEGKLCFVNLSLNGGGSFSSSLEKEDRLDLQGSRVRQQHGAFLFAYLMSTLTKVAVLHLTTGALQQIPLPGSGHSLDAGIVSLIK